MKIDQIAWYAHNEDQVRRIKDYYGLLNAKWVEDYAQGSVTITRPNGELIGGHSHGHLRFNYDLGIELEILTYLEGPHWHQTDERFILGKPFLSHIGVHCEPHEVVTPLNMVQEMFTKQHTNPYLLERNRTYHYVIDDTRAMLGHYTKYIWRIEKGK